MKSTTDSNGGTAAALTALARTPEFAQQTRLRPKGRTRAQGRTRAFTLLELMIALAVLAIVSVAVFGRGGDTVRQLGTLEEKTVARWLAEDAVADLRLARLGAGQPIRPETQNNRVRRGERVWRVRTETKATSHPALFRVEVTVSSLVDGRDVGPVDTLTAFIGAH